MLVDSGAEISIIAIKGCPMEAADQVKSVSGIGEAQKVGPKTECNVRSDLRVTLRKNTVYGFMQLS